MSYPASTAPADNETNIFYLQDLARRIPDVISLGLGDPDLPTPPHIVDAVRRAFDAGSLEPPEPRGLLTLREAISRKLQRDNRLVLDPEREVLVTTGSQEALFLLIQALLDPGDEILVPDPRYPSYDTAINVAGGRMVLIPTGPEHDFEVQPDEIEQRISPRTKGLLLISPSNPTGAVISPENVRRIAQIAVERDLIVVSDEIYETLVFDDGEHLSIGSLPGMAERTVTLNGFSKSYSMTGWRVGYLTGPAPLIDAMTEMKAMLNGHAPLLSQVAATAALNGSQACVEEMRQTYARRRRLMMDGLGEMGFTFGGSQGAFYLWADASAAGVNATRLSYHLLQEARVLVFPGTAFGERWTDYLRFTLLQPEPRILEALERIDSALKALPDARHPR
jgi:aminotransferase